MAMSKAWELVRGIPTVIDITGNAVSFDIGGTLFPAAPGTQGQILKITDASGSPAICGWGSFSGMSEGDGQATAIALG
tara:strand:+ start:260 stop:493 length:234 start_codon:yes stop_codon:yes gene_type:complete